MKYLIANWKSNFTIKEAQNWIEIVKKDMPVIPSNLKIVVCPSYIHHLLFKLNFPNQLLGLQTISPFPSGTYTGAISSQMVKDLVQYVIVGHSERRIYFKESFNDVSNQVSQALDFDLTPIIAVDNDNWFSQLSIIKEEEIKNCLVMYEPPEAISKPQGPIGEGESAPVKKVVDAINQIKTEFSPKGFIYGGSVKSNNILEFISKPEIDGVLPGSASLSPEEWLKMITIALQAVIKDN